MRIQRYRRPSRYRSTGCMAVLILSAAAVFLGVYLLLTTPLLTTLALRLMGASSIGQTDALFSETTGSSEPAPARPVQNVTYPGQMRVTAGVYGENTLYPDAETYTIATGIDASGRPAATITVNEAGLRQLCDQRTTVCSGQMGRFRNAYIDLRPGGVVVYVDVNAGVWQRVGVVFRLMDNGRRFDVPGVDVGGILYDVTTLPDDMRQQVQEVERIGNDLLAQLTVNTGGQRYNLDSVTFTHDDAVITLR